MALRSNVSNKETAWTTPFLVRRSMIAVIHCTALVAILLVKFEVVEECLKSYSNLENRAHLIEAQLTFTAVKL